MTSERIKEIQSGTAYPESVSVKEALLQVWNECQQEFNAKQDKANLGMATTSELIYELAARCDTGSIDRGGNYKTVDND